MSCRNRITGQRQCPLIELFKLQKAVAVDAGIGGSPISIALNKRTDHTVVERIRQIENIIGHLKPVCHAACILDIFQ